MTSILLTFAAVFLLILSGGLLIFNRDALLQRLANVVSPRAESGENWIRRFTGKESIASLAKAFDPIQKILPKSLEEISITERRLMLAGFRKNSHIKIFYGAKVLTPITLVVLVTVTGLYDYGAFFVYALAAALGY